MDGQTDGQTDKVKPVYPHFDFVEAGGITTARMTHNKNLSVAKFYCKHKYDGQLVKNTESECIFLVNIKIQQAVLFMLFFLETKL